MGVYGAELSVSPMTVLLALLLVVGCATTPPPPPPSIAEFGRAFVARWQAYCATAPDRAACDRAVIWSQTRPLPVAMPPPPQTIIMQQPPAAPPRHRYWGPRTPYGVPSAPGIVPVYPIE